MNRSSGVLLHISSLPGDYSVGSLGASARAFVDFLRDCGFSYWQILPTTEVDEVGSPYRSPSAFAGNPYFIDLDELCKIGLLTRSDLAAARQNSPYLCEFERLSKERLPLLRRAFLRIDDDVKNKIEAFREANPWLENYAEFMALRDENSGAAFNKWNEIKFKKEIISLVLQYT